MKLLDQLVARYKAGHIDFFGSIIPFLGSAAGGAFSKIAGPILGSTVAGLFGANQAKKSNQWQENAIREQRAYNEYMDIGIPFHKQSWESREAQIGQMKRGLHIDNEYANKRVADLYGMAKGEGATLQEFLGSPAAGGSGSGGGASQNILGTAQSQNQAAAQISQQESQMKFQAQQNNLDRQTSLMQTAMETGTNLSGQLTQERGQDTQMNIAQLEAETKELTTQILADANITSASINAQASIKVAQIGQNTELIKLYEAMRVNDATIKQVNAATAATIQTMDQAKTLFGERWVRDTMNAGPEKVLGSLYLILSGHDPAEIFAQIDPSDRVLVEQALDNLDGATSGVRQTGEGIIKLGKDHPVVATILGMLTTGGAGAAAARGLGKLGAGKAIGEGYTKLKNILGSWRAQRRQDKTFRNRRPRPRGYQ